MYIMEEGKARSLLLLIFVSIMTGKVIGRPIMTGGQDEFISDGLPEVDELQLFKEGGDNECVQLYGFLPCSHTPIGHLFLVVVYEYLLFHAEWYVAHGGRRIFKLQGPGLFGASAFHILGFLPEAIILLASGLLEGKEVAEEYVLTGVGLLAGSTTLLLTLLWGTCILMASQDFPSSNPRNLLTGRGIVTDSGTKYMARIMVLSLIPFLLIQIPETLNLSASGEQIVILITILFSVLFLLAYFLYQVHKMEKQLG